MICEKCGVNNATTRIRRIVNGVIYEKHLCSSCAASEGYTQNNNDFSQILSSLFGNKNEPIKKSNIEQCSCCGYTFADITKSGKCGCPECYNTFYDQLLPYLKKAQFDRTTHKGKIPNTTKPSVESQKEELIKLKTLLNELVKAEKFEEAAEIRDRIKMLEGGIQ